MAMTLPKIGDIKKFSFGEMTSNDNGKTSATSTSGVYIIFIGGLCFFLGCIDKMFLDKSIDIINQSVMFTTIGAALLGVKNVINGKQPKAEKAEDAKPEAEQLNS
jgi:hypothetical protein